MYFYLAFNGKIFTFILSLIADQQQQQPGKDTSICCGHTHRGDLQGVS